MQSNSSSGGLDVYEVYMHPSSAAERLRLLQQLRKVIRKNAHSILVGDWNYVLIAEDRTKFDGGCIVPYEGRDVEFWKTIPVIFESFTNRTLHAETHMG